MNSGNLGPIEDLFRDFDGKLRALIRGMGIDDTMAQEDIAQDTWAKLVARRNAGRMPRHPRAWIKTVARRRVLEIIEREDRMREREKTATDRNRAAGDHPFRIDDAIAVVETRLSNREQQILAASQRCQTTHQLAQILGYPTPKIASTMRARVRKRLERILGEDVDVSFFFMPILDETVASSVAKTPGTRRDEAEVDWDSISEVEPRSSKSEEEVLERLSQIAVVASDAKAQVGSLPLLGSFASLFDRLLSEGVFGSNDLWALALGLTPEDIADLRAGERTVLELDPDTVVMMSDMLGLEARDVALMGLGDVGLRPVQDDAGLAMRESLIPREEADFRVESILAEAKEQEMALE